jgi:hypothetical protein
MSPLRNRTPSTSTSADGSKREPVLAAWGYTVEGRRVLLHLMAGSKEDAETVTAFFEDMKMRGLNDPVCTENSIRVDNATESPNLSGDDRPVLPLLVPVRLAVQIEEST